MTLDKFKTYRFAPGMEFLIIEQNPTCPVWKDLIAVDFEDGECESHMSKHHIGDVVDFRFIGE